MLFAIMLKDGHRTSESQWVPFVLAIVNAPLEKSEEDNEGQMLESLCASQDMH